MPNPVRRSDQEIKGEAIVFTSEAFRAEWSPRLLSILRIVVALLYLQHGLSKWFGFPGAQPPNFSLFSYPVGLASVIEVVGSLALLVGFYTRLAALIMSGEMAIAFWTAHIPRGWSQAGVMGLFPYNNAGNLPILYCFVFLYLALVGGGPWSIDQRRA